MRLEIENNQLDLGTTPIENMFINTYLSKANEIQIKVYLFALMSATSGNKNVTNLNIASEMGLTEGQVVDSWNYWVNEGVVEIIGDRYVFKSIRYKYIKALNSELEELESNSQFNEDWKDDSDNLSAIESKEMIENIEQFISQDQLLPQKLNEREIKKIILLMNDFAVSPEYISYAYMMASNVRGMKAVDPIVATIRNWLIDGATDLEKLEIYLANKENEKEIKEEKKSTKSNNSENLYKKDDRMSKEERTKFIENKLKRKLPINKKGNK